MKGKYEAPVQKKNSKKGIALLLVLFLLVGCVIGTTMAWLTDTTTPITNTFTVGDINLSLDETTGDTYKMTPKSTIAKNPIVTVTKGSENCYVFVKVEKTNFQSFMSYEMDPAWTALADVDNVFYAQADSLEAVQDVTFHVLKDDQILISDGMTKDYVDNYTEGNAPKLTITAYAIQSAGLSDVNSDSTIDAKDAWQLGGWS